MVTQAVPTPPPTKPAAWRLGEHGIPFVILLTKADKSAKQQVEKKLAALQSALSSMWEVLPQIFVTSSRDKTGREELLYYIQRTLGKHNA